ncbi:cupin domain-containing protein, partial [Singulisphaera rosea]
TLHFQVDGRELDAGPGTWITLPKGSVHAFKNTGSTTAKMLIHVAPSGLERYFLEVGREPTDGGQEPVIPTPEDFQKLLAAAPKYGLDIRPPSH